MSNIFSHLLLLVLLVLVRVIWHRQYNCDCITRGLLLYNTVFYTTAQQLLRWATVP